MLFLISLIPISQLDGVRNYLRKDKFLIAKSKNRGIANGEALEVYAQSLPTGFKRDISLHPQGCGICRGAVLEFVRLLSQLTEPGKLPTEQDIRLIASQFSNGAPVNAVIFQRLRDEIGDRLALHPYNIRLVDPLPNERTVFNEKEFFDLLQNVDAGIYSLMSRYHSTLFIKISNDHMFFFDPLHGTYRFTSLEDIRSVILHSWFFREYGIQKVIFDDP
ncbi:MAG TPA: hypothetical protein VLG76_03265 [Rhabdochlamydiaceae bacterium]|nr:hypothetical protein [Rhabdochlamydiaceae bacterium]